MKPAKPLPRSPSESIFTRLYHDAVSKRQETPTPAVPTKVERRLSKAVTNALVKKLVGEQYEKAYRRLRDRKKGVEREMREIRAAPAISQTSRRIATRCRSRDGNVVFRVVPRLERRKKPPKEVELRLADLEEAVAAPINPPPFTVKETVFQQAKDEFLLLDSKHRPSSVTQLSQESSEVYLADLLTPKMFTDMFAGSAGTKAVSDYAEGVRTEGGIGMGDLKTRICQLAVERQDSSSEDLQAHTLLQMLNPKGRPQVPLDDLVKSALQSYVLEKKTFSISRDEMLEVLSGLRGKQSIKESEPAKRIALRRPSVEPPLFSSPDPKAPIPASIRKTIRNLSLERQFIAYGSDMNLTPFKPTHDRQRRGSRTALDESQRRVTSVAPKESEKTEEKTTYTRFQSRKASLHSTIQFDDPALVISRQPKPSPAHATRTQDCSFVGSSATTPKRGRPLLRNPSPKRESKVVVPSLKEGMEKLARDREQMWKDSD